MRVAGAAGRAFAVVARRLARPTPAGHEVVVRVVGAGASHADVHIQDEPLDVALPVVLGHEIAWVAGRYGPRHSADQRRLGGPALAEERTTDTHLRGAGAGPPGSGIEPVPVM